MLDNMIQLEKLWKILCENNIYLAICVHNIYIARAERDREKQIPPAINRPDVADEKSSGLLPI